jgi:hypothetical protein
MVGPPVGVHAGLMTRSQDDFVVWPSLSRCVARACSVRDVFGGGGVGSAMFVKVKGSAIGTLLLRGRRLYTFVDVTPRCAHRDRLGPSGLRPGGFFLR